MIVIQQLEKKAEKVEEKIIPVEEEKPEIVEPTLNHPTLIKDVEEAEKIYYPSATPIITRLKEEYKSESYEPKPIKKNINIEKFIGENLINKIGIGVLVLGIGFFVKYAIDKNWINEVARMFIGIACGFILLGIGYWLRKKYTAFTSVLTGGGIAVLYFSFYIAFQEYKIISQTLAFILLILGTAFTVALSLWYNRRELAIIGIIGGFASPLMISTGEGNYIVIFSYLFILNVGMIVLAFHKKWKEINIITYFFTVILQRVR